MNKIYLAIPYTGIEEQSFDMANQVCAELLMQGSIVYSPITHSHILAKDYGLRGDWDFWSTIDVHFIDWCDEVVIVIPPDYLGGVDLLDKSKGVTAEMIYAAEKKKVISYYDYEKRKTTLTL